MLCPEGKAGRKPWLRTERGKVRTSGAHRCAKVYDQGQLEGQDVPGNTENCSPKSSGKVAVGQGWEGKEELRGQGEEVRSGLLIFL